MKKFNLKANVVCDYVYSYRFFNFLYPVLIIGTILLIRKRMWHCLVEGFHTAQFNMIGRLCPEGLGVALNNDDALPDGLRQAPFLLHVSAPACT